MSEPRLKSKISASAFLRMGDLAGKPGMVVRRGDPDSGAILLCLHGRAGSVLLGQTRDAAGEPAWIRLSGAEPVEPAAIDALITRQTRFDADLWVLEFECPDLIPPFELRMIAG